MAKAKAKAEQPPLFGDGEIGPAPDKLLTDAKDAWNEHAKAIQNWPEIKILDDSRSTKLKKAIRTSGGLVGWREMLREAAKSDVLTGRAAWTKGSKWFNFDWLIKPANLVKVLEGNYKNPEAEPVSFAQQMKGVGVKSRYAEPPKPFVAESQDVRELAMIESYTKHGRYADANRIVEQRAKRLGIPAVLIPDPSVAHVGMPPKQPVQRAQPKPAPHAAPNGSAAPGPRKAAAVTDIVPDWLNEPIPDSAYGEN